MRSKGQPQIASLQHRPESVLDMSMCVLLQLTMILMMMSAHLDCNNSPNQFLPFHNITSHSFKDVMREQTMAEIAGCVGG